MNPIDQPDIDQFDNWLDLLVAGHQAQSLEDLDDLSATAVWLNGQRLKVSCTGRVERRIKAQLKGARAGLFLVPYTPKLEHLAARRPSHINSFRPYGRDLLGMAASLVVLVPFLIVVARHFTPEDDPRSIPAPAISVGQIGTPALESVGPFMLLPNSIILGDDALQPEKEIYVGSSQAAFELNFANRGDKPLVFVLPELNIEKLIGPGSIVHLLIQDPPATTPFEIRVPSSDTPEHEGEVIFQRVTPQVTLPPDTPVAGVWRP